MKFLALILSVLPCCLLAQIGTNTTIDTTEPSVLSKLYEVDSMTFGNAGSVKLQEGWKRFNNEHVSNVDFPKNWKIVENFMETVFLIKEPIIEEENGDVFAENVNLVREFAQSSKSDDANFSLNNYVEEKIVEHRNYFEDFDIIEHKDGLYRNDRAVILLFTGKASNIEFKIKQCFFLLNEHVYIFSFTAQTDQFDNYLPIATDIYKSLKVN